MNFYLGCAVWSHKDWVGNLYPAKSQPRDFLRLYSHRFTTVEGNTTFYALPSAETIAKWVKQTPPGFKFCPKLHRQVTHQGLLTPHIPDALNFFERMSGLGDRLGTTFIQLPPNYSFTYLSDLTEFLTACSQYNQDLALEVRHLDWFKPEAGESLNSLLKELNLARVLLDTRPIYNCPDDPQIGSPRKKPQVPLLPTLIDNTAFVRFISHPERQYNQAYLTQWTTELQLWLAQGKTVYFFVHCPQEVRSPDTAKLFHSLLASQLSLLSPSTLPWNSIEPNPTQLSLF
ncbi:MAG: DUF72 domain-containing protein [Cyanobacteria bacterium P01_C01_bin.72]